jgi:predicted small lipoprotein YifL
MRARFVLAVAAALSAAACGQVGPLYLRDKPPPNIKPAPPAPYQPVPYPQDTGENGTKSEN